MAGLLDYLTSPDTGNGIGGLLSYLQPSPYQSPIFDQKKRDASFLDALQASNGETPDITPQAAPSVFPNYVPPAPPSVFQTGAAPVATGLQIGQQPVAPQQGAPAPPAVPPQAVAPPPDASPIQVGNYMMPRVGPASDFEPQQAALPPNAQPVQGQLPQAPQVPQSGGPAFMSSDQPGFMTGYQNFKNGGGLIGSIFAGATGQRNDPVGIQQQNMAAQFRATAKALMDNGVPPQQAASTAMLSVLNPEAAKTVLPELLTNKEKYQVIADDPLFGKKYGFVNEREQTINGRPLGQQGSDSSALGSPADAQAILDKVTAMRTQGASRDQMLAQIPAGYRDDVASLLSGKGVPANMGRATARMAILTLAKTVDPNFDETQIPGRVAMRKDFMGEGKNGQAIGALNTVQHHADQVSDAIEDFQKAGGGTNYPLLNAGKLMLANNTGANPQLRDAAQKLKDKLNATEHEVAAAYNAGHLSDRDLATWNEIKAANLPADQLKQKLADFVDLLNGKRDSLNHMYRQQFQEDAPAIDKQANDATTAKIHSRAPQYAGTAPSNSLPAGWSVKVR